MMILPTFKKTFVLLSCTFLGLICGTLYLYSSYSPQFAKRLNYSVSDSSNIAQFGTIGTAISGPLSGKVVDKKGYTWALVIGGLSILCGYLGMKKQFDHEYSSLFISYMLLFLIGSGSTFINSACLKCCAMTFPSIRGVATSLPLALYGLSALFYSVIASIFFPGNTSKFLGFLAYSSLTIFSLCSPIIILTDREHNLKRSLSLRTGGGNNNNNNPQTIIEMANLKSPGAGPTPQLSPYVSNKSHMANTPSHSRNVSQGGGIQESEELSGQELFFSMKFWIIFFITGFLAAMGQMYIYSVGYIVKALVGKGIPFETTITSETKQQIEAVIQKNQQFQVGLLSMMNCIGRLLSGIFGDIITQSFNRRRSWLLYVPAIGLTLTQIIGHQLSDYHNLSSMSLLTGFFYGFTFCIMPIIVGDMFGMDNFSSNWGIVCLAPILPSFYFTNLFGKIFDANSVVASDGNHVCTMGKDCYSSIFSLNLFVTLFCLCSVSFLNFGYNWLSRSSVTSSHSKV